VTLHARFFNEYDVDTHVVQAAVNHKHVVAVMRSAKLQSIEFRLDEVSAFLSFMDA
jgi:hypothetical protein